jgi:hypothetical protein
MDNIATIIGTLATVLFSAGAWQFYEKRMKMKSEENKADRSEQNMYRDDLKQRVKRLEQLLEASAGEKDAMRAQILALYYIYKHSVMKLVEKIKSVVTSDLFVVGAALVTGAVVFAKGMPLIGGIAIGVAGVKLWGVLKK